MNLIDALALAHIGWKTEAEGIVYRNAMTVIHEHALIVRKQELIRELEQELAQLKEQK